MKGTVVEVLGNMLLVNGKDAWHDHATCSYTALKRGTELSSSSLTRALELLQKHGLVESTAVFAKKCFEYRLTKQGFKLAAKYNLDAFAGVLEKAAFERV